MKNPMAIKLWILAAAREEEWKTLCVSKPMWRSDGTWWKGCGKRGWGSRKYQKSTCVLASVWRKCIFLKKKKRCVAWGVGEELSHFSKTWQGREIQRNLMDAWLMEGLCRKGGILGRKSTVSLKGKLFHLSLQFSLRRLPSSAGPWARSPTHPDQSLHSWPGGLYGNSNISPLETTCWRTCVFEGGPVKHLDFSEGKLHLWWVLPRFRRHSTGDWKTDHCTWRESFSQTSLQTASLPAPWVRSPVSWKWKRGYVNT